MQSDLSEVTMGKITPYLCKYVLPQNTEAVENIKEAFNSTLKHDLKTPTIAQIRSLELVLSGIFGELNFEQREVLTHTLESCRYMYVMINNAINTYSADDPKDLFTRKEFNFCTLVKECCIELTKMAGAKGQNINFKSQMQEILIKAHKTQLKHALTNVLYECISRGYENTGINVLVEKLPNMVSFTVNANSPNIAPQVLNEIFKNAPVGSAKFNKIGASLGLSLAYKIITSHQGIMFAESEDNIVTFKFLIPII